MTLRLIRALDNKTHRANALSSDIDGFGIEKEFLVLDNGAPVRKDGKGVIEKALHGLMAGFEAPKSQPAKIGEQDAAQFDIETLEQGIAAGYLITPEYIGPSEDDCFIGLEIRSLPCTQIPDASRQLTQLEKLLYEAFDKTGLTVAPLAVHTQHNGRPAFVSPSLQLHISHPKEVWEAAVASAKFEYSDGRPFEPKTEHQRKLLGIYSFGMLMENIYPIIAALAANSTDRLQRPRFYDYKVKTYTDLADLSDTTSQLSFVQATRTRPEFGTLELRNLDSMVSVRDTLVPTALAVAYSGMLAEQLINGAPDVPDGGTGVCLGRGTATLLLALENSKRVARDGANAKLLFATNPKEIMYFENYAFGHLVALHNSGLLGSVGVERGWFWEGSVKEHLCSIRPQLAPHLKQIGAPDEALDLIFAGDKCQSFKHERIGDEHELAFRAADDSAGNNSWYATKTI